MNFLKNNWEVLILVILTIMGEVFHLLFIDVPFYREGYNLDTPIYYIMSQIGLLTFTPSIIIFILLPKEKISSRAIAFGLVIWNIKEVMDEIFYLLGINLNVFEINSSFWGQIVFILTVVGLSSYGFYKLKS